METAKSDVSSTPNGRSADRTSYWFGVFAGVVPWIGIAIYLFGPPTAAPTFVSFVFLSIFVSCNVFARPA